MDWTKLGHRLGKIPTYAKHSGDIAAPHGRIDSDRTQDYGAFEERGLREDVEEDQEENLDDTDVLVQYEGVTRDGALQLSFDYNKHGSDTRKSPRRDSKHSHKIDEPEPEPDVSRPAPPPLSVVMMVTGTRGDVQPFLVSCCLEECK